MLMHDTSINYVCEFYNCVIDSIVVIINIILKKCCVIICEPIDHVQVTGVVLNTSLTWDDNADRMFDRQSAVILSELLRCSGLTADDLNIVLSKRYWAGLGIYLPCVALQL